MQRKILIGSLILNVLLIALIVGGGFALMNYAKTFSRIPAERWRTQFDFLTDTKHGIVFLGDSITEGGHWSEIFSNGAVLNRGIGGDTTQDVLDRIEQVYTLQPAKLFLMIGVNDLNQGAPIATTLANYQKLFDGFAAHLPQTKIYIQSVLPVNRHWYGGAKNKNILALNTFLFNESAKRGYTFIDLQKPFSDSNGELREELSNDGIHLLGSGYQLWRTAIGATVAE
jgi:lysophospholipase L1-like esterase